MVTILLILLGIGIFFYLFMHLPQFGRKPSGSSLRTILNSPNYKNGKFQNLSYTPSLKEGVSYFKVMKEFFFNKRKDVKPPSRLPSVKTNLFNINLDEDILVWFGHSSYYIQLDNKRILVDPVFSGNASPVKFTTKSFEGTDLYTPQDIPEIDYLVITHDHWDHLDYQTVLKLKPKIKKVITGLGVGAALESWGFRKDIIIERDWNEQVKLEDGFILHTVPARHFSGRGFKRNGSLWMSFVLITPSYKIFLGGDSGYDTHFKKIGQDFGPFDLAILENGQYNEYWKYIHMMPEEVVMAAEELKAKKLMPVHWGKFNLSLHSWDEPIERISREAEIRKMPLIHPMIGERVNLKENSTFPKWWKTVN